MPDQVDTPADINIEPTGRDIGILSPTLGTAEGTDFGVFKPFSGLLQPDRHRQREWHGPALEYLTLQPLVVQHVRERTTHETETVERTDTTVQTGDTGEDTDASPAESMTVREYIQQQQVRDESGLSSPDSSSAPSPEGSHEQPDTDEDGAPVPRADQPSTPLPDTGPGDRPQSNGSPTDPSPGQRDPLSWTTLDTTPPETAGVEGGDGGSIGSTGGSDRGPVGPTEQPDTPPPTPQQGDPFGGQDRSRDIGPDLVVADSSLPGDAPSARTASTEDTATKLSDRQTASSEPGGGQPIRGEQSMSRDGSDSSQDRTPSSEPPPDPSSTAPQTPADQSVPLSLDQVEQPTLDRFVEELSEKLARHERVERERRGL